MEMWCDGGDVPLDEARLRFEVNVFGLAQPRPARHVANAAVSGRNLPLRPPEIAGSFVNRCRRHYGNNANHGLTNRMTRKRLITFIAVIQFVLCLIHLFLYETWTFSAVGSDTHAAFWIKLVRAFRRKISSARADAGSPRIDTFYCIT